MPNNRKFVKQILANQEAIRNDFARVQYLDSVPDSTKVTDHILEEARKTIRRLYLRSKIKLSYEEIACAVATLGLDNTDDTILQWIGDHPYHNE